MKKVYIAHPLVGDGSPEWGNRRRNFDRYLAICAWVMRQHGVAVVSWAHHELLADAGRLPDDAEFHLVRDERLIDGCDELWVAGPPQVSAGLRREIAYAESKGVLVDYLGLYHDWTWPRRPDAVAPSGMRDLVQRAHLIAVRKGWWGDAAASALEGEPSLALGDADYAPRNLGMLVALMHSELSEALEELRAGRSPNEVYFREDGKPEGFGVELADTLIRIFDTCGRYGIDLEALVKMKMSFNESRPYRHGGKLA